MFDKLERKDNWELFKFVTQAEIATPESLEAGRILSIEQV
jgi:hypothetical protein